MFAVKIHTVNFPQHLHTTFTSTAGTANRSNNLKPAERLGVAHLFRQLPSADAPSVTFANISARSTLVYVVAVPNYLSPDDFILFCGNHVPHFVEILFLRNDGMKDRYGVLIRLENQSAGDEFYCNYNGKRFNSSELHFQVEFCRVYFVQSVKYTGSAEIASTPPPGYTELPSCPVCLERLNADTSGIPSTFCDHSFHSSCIFKWTNLSCPVCRLCQQPGEKPACAVCGSFKNVWVCLICGFVGCGRHENGHALGHWIDKQHRFSLGLEEQQIWDYVGDKFVHRLNQSKVDEKSVIVNSRHSSVEERGTSGEGLYGALFSSKIEGILDKYNRLLASQLDIQRQHFESLLNEASSRIESSTAKAVEKAIFSKTHELEYKLEKYAEEKKAAADGNLRDEELMKKQEFLENKLKEIEERGISLLKTKDEQILDLQEQIRDLKVYVEAQRMVTGTGDSNGIRGGTILPVEKKQFSSSSSKSRSKSGRRGN